VSNNGGRRGKKSLAIIGWLLNREREVERERKRGRDRMRSRERKRSRE